MEFTSADQLVGQNIGIYQIDRLLQRGQVSAVYLAHHPEHRRSAALTTFLLPEKLSSSAHHRFLQRFQTEAMKLVLLRHKHILPIYEYGEHAGYPYLITPYITNGSLVDIMKYQKQFQYADILALLQEVMAGLAYAHAKGIVHGTVKPSNIILGDQGETLVAGFGLRDILQMHGIEPDDRPYAHLLSIGRTFLTPPEYITPEVVQGKLGDPRSDIYSLGLIVFELLSGKLPFTGTNPLEVAQQHVRQQVPPLRSFCPDIPLLLAAVVNQALERNPERRFQTVNELAEAFAQVTAVFLEGENSRSSSDDPRGTTHLTHFPETPAQGYAIGNWQIQPPVVANKLAAVEPIIQKRHSVTKGTSVPLTRGRSDAQPPVHPVTRKKKQDDADAASLPPHRIVPHAPQPPHQAPPTLVPPVQEPDASLLLPSEAEESRFTKSPRAITFDGWETPLQGPLPSPSANIPQWNMDGTRERPTSNRRSRSAQRRGIRENHRVSRRRAIALLTTGGIAAAASATAVLSIRHIIGK